MICAGAVKLHYCGNIDSQFTEGILFESDFLSNSADSRNLYQQLISRTAAIVAGFLPNQPYEGKTPAELSGLIPSDFLPSVARSPDQIAETLCTIVCNSINVAHPNTVAHLHCPPLLAALAAEVVITALNQSMDSFDQAPIATIVEQKMIRWLCAEAGLPATADGTFTTGGSQSNYMGLLLARDAISAEAMELVSAEIRPAARGSPTAHFLLRGLRTSRSRNQRHNSDSEPTRSSAVAVDDHFRMSPSAFASALESLRRAKPASDGNRRHRRNHGLRFDRSPAGTRRNRPFRQCVASRRRSLRRCVTLFVRATSRKLAGIEPADSLGHRLPQALLAAHPVQRFSAARCAPASTPSNCTPTISIPNSTRTQASRTWSRLPCSPPAASTP